MITHTQLSNLLEQLSEAHFVRYDSNGIVIAWHGGHTFNVFSEIGECLDCWTLSDEHGEPVSLARAIESVDSHLREYHTDGED